jgi:hypothetical protein
MKKPIPILFLLLGLIGCVGDPNTVTIHNAFDAGVLINFRGEVYSVKAGERRTISDIPLGEYPFITTHVIPSWHDTLTGRSGLYEPVDIDSTSGMLSFTRYGIGYYLFFGGAVYNEDTTYTINLSITSNISGL